MFCFFSVFLFVFCCQRFSWVIAYATSMYSTKLCGVPWSNLTKYLSDFYLFICLFIFPSYSTVSVKVISSTLMWMRKLIWVCTGRKVLIVPKVFSKSPSSVSSKLGSFPWLVLLKYLSMLPCSLNIIGCPLVPQKILCSFIYSSSTQHGP